MPELKIVLPGDLNPPLNAIRVVDPQSLTQLQAFFDRTLAEKNGILGFDIETTPVKDFFYRRCRTVQFGTITEQYVVDLLALCDNDPELLHHVQGDYGKRLHLAPRLSAFIKMLEPVLCSASFLKVGVNLAFEYMNFYWLFGLRSFHFFDCSLAEKCIWAGGHSLKDYGFYSMEEMMARYFHLQIDKKYQESFTLDAQLDDDQINYAALDTRYPLALRHAILLVLEGKTVQSCREAGQFGAALILSRLDPLVLSDNLVEIAQIENDAIGAFEDMHVHGERINRERWLSRIAERERELRKLVDEVLDPIFIPLVGNKADVVTDQQVDEATAKWKTFVPISEEEIRLKGLLRSAKKHSPESAAVLEQQLAGAEAARKDEKNVWKAVASDLSKRRTRLNKLVPECQGNALINYSSNKQLLDVLVHVKGLSKLKDLEDETLVKYQKYPAIAAIRSYHSLTKEIGTYGTQWATEWKTKPCKEEGWLHPGDGRLHCVFNQYEAETGRSSSEKPNGQNLPQDKEVRSCFIADPPDESIRISNCCDAEVQDHHCTGCNQTVSHEDTHAEEYVLVTADMSGAELRIIAEEANDEVWITAFERKEDVHSVGTELLYETEWPQFTEPGCAYFQLHTEATVATNVKAQVGDLMRQKCNCPKHKEMRDDNKSTNFLLAYGGGPYTLAVRIGKPVEVAKELMERHRAKNPRIWAYLEESGRKAKIFKRSFDMFGRRRLFPEPTWERAKEKAKLDREEKLRFTPEVCDRNRQNFMAVHKRKPDKDEMWELTHRLPVQAEVANAFKAMHSTIERQGKNHPIQGANSSIAKKAMGAGHCPAGKPYLWHTLPLYKAKLIKFVHDELVVQCPKRFGQSVADLIGDAFRRAAAEKMKRVVMEFDYHIATYWKK